MDWVFSDVAVGRQAGRKVGDFLGFDDHDVAVDNFDLACSDRQFVWGASRMAKSSPSSV
jgi:hypothetical protein